MYLLDANTLIRASIDYYPIHRIPQFWDWLIERGKAGEVKIPDEIVKEIVAVPDAVSAWLKDPDTKTVMRLNETADVATVRRVVAVGYAPDLNDAEQEKLGQDPFLIAHGLGGPHRTIVTKEVPAPAKQRANRKVPDVCDALGVRWITDFQFYDEANFTIP